MILARWRRTLTPHSAPRKAATIRTGAREPASGPSGRDGLRRSRLERNGAHLLSRDTVALIADRDRVAVAILIELAIKTPNTAPTATDTVVWVAAWNAAPLWCIAIGVPWAIRVAAAFIHGCRGFRRCDRARRLVTAKRRPLGATTQRQTGQQRQRQDGATAIPDAGSTSCLGDVGRRHDYAFGPSAQNAA